MNNFEITWNNPFFQTYLFFSATGIYRATTIDLLRFVQFTEIQVTHKGSVSN